MSSAHTHPGAAQRAVAALVGALFIVGTASGILAGALTAPIRGAAIYPLNVAAGGPAWLIGALLVLLMGLSLAMVPVLLYPALRAHGQALALGAVLFRGVLEVVSGIMVVLSMLMLVSAGEHAAGAGAAGQPSAQALGALLVAAGEWSQIVGGIVFSIGTLMIFTLMYRGRLIPRWLSLWGLAGAALYLIANIASMLGPQHTAPVVGEGLGILLAPTAAQEMVFAVWLIARGLGAAAPPRPADALPRPA